MPIINATALPMKASMNGRLRTIKVDEKLTYLKENLLKFVIIVTITGWAEYVIVLVKL